MEIITDETKTKTKRSKPLIDKQTANRTKFTIIGLMLIVVIMFGGTFAFTQLNQIAFGPDAVNVIPGGRMHDIFELREEGTTVSLNALRNRDVFAENFGETPIGVRVQFFEFLTLNDIPMVNTDYYEDRVMRLNDVYTWSLFQANNDLTRRTGTTAQIIGDSGVIWHMGQSDENPNIYMPTFNQVNRLLTDNELHLSQVNEDSIFYNTHTYVFTDTSGRAVEGRAGGFDITGANITSVQDIEFYGRQTGTPNHTGLSDFFSLGDTRTAYRYSIGGANNTLIREEVTHTVRPALIPDEGGVMSLNSWIEAGMPVGNFWIMDTENPGGWFYWNGLIPGGSATSLLLDGTEMPVHTRFEYVIHLNSDFFTRNDLPTDISEDARQIFERRFEINAELGEAVESGIVPGEEGIIIENLNLIVYPLNDSETPQLINNPEWQIRIMDSDTESRLEKNDVIILLVDEEEDSESIMIQVDEVRAPNSFIFHVRILLE